MRGLGIFVGFLALSAMQAATPEEFYKAIRANDLATLSRLATSGDVNAKDARGSTPLMHASLIGSVEAMRTLIKSGADVNAVNNMGVTALIGGATDPERVRLLLDAGAKVDPVSRQGRTALLAAASSPQATASVRMLLDRGTKLTDADSTGMTPLHAATAWPCAPSTVRLLLSKGADVKALDKGGFSPLIAAAGACPADIVKDMLSRGADVHVANSSSSEVKFGKIALTGLNALMFAAPHQGVDIIRLLLDAGAKVNAVDGRGMTALMFAVSSERQDPAVVKLLLDRGADPSIKSKAGETALDWARKFNTPSILKLLGALPAKSAPNLGKVASGSDRASAARALDLVLKSSSEFFRQSGCVACHHQNLAGLAAAEARKARMPVDEKLAGEQLGQNKGMWTFFQTGLQQMMDPPGAYDMAVYALLQFEAAGYPADPVTDALLHYSAGKQTEEGAWSAKGIARSPLEEGDIHRAALGIRALLAYAPAGRKQEMEKRVARAKKYLLTAKASTTDDHAMRLLGLLWAGEPAASIRSFATNLLNSQRSDGGFGGNPHLPSDAYSTAQALYALKAIGSLKPADPPAARATAFLLRTQNEDGSWLVRSRAPKFQPYFESGFPHGHDQWISASATAWAVMALAK